jgi:LPXTG-motif cell wall-anchored protein
MTTPFDNVDDNEPEPYANEEPTEDQPEGSNNRTFLTVVAILGGIMLLTLLCIGVYAVWLGPRNEAARQTQAADAIIQATAVAFSVQETERAAKATPTRPSPTPTRAAATNTAVVALAATSTQTPLGGPNLTQTVAALITQGAAAAKTPVVTSTALPQTGFAEDVGLPGLLGVAVVLVVVIFLTRRLRTAS